MLLLCYVVLSNAFRRYLEFGIGSFLFAHYNAKILIKLSFICVSSLTTLTSYLNFTEPQNAAYSKRQLYSFELPRISTDPLISQLLQNL